MTTIAANHALDTNLAVSPRAGTSRGAAWTGRVLSGLGVLFMLFDGGAKVLNLLPPEAKQNNLGWQEHHLFTLGALALVCTALYLIPRTAVIGAILLTGYFGGAIATHVRVDNPLFSHTLFPVYIAAFFWVGLWLRDERVRAIIAPR